MNQSISPAAAIVTGLIALTALLGFGGWMSYGSDMFIAMALNGLSWCL